MMRWVDDQESTYGCRLICNGSDIDDVMEEKYLKFYKGSTVNMNHPALDLDGFIETLSPDIEYDQEAEGLSVFILGATKFNADGTRLIQINANLYRQSNSSASKGRFRFTCAHEIFHAIFHTELFNKSGNAGYIRCFDHHIKEDMVAETAQTMKDFTEWQANRGAAALLMPVSIFKEKVKQIRRKSHNHDFIVGELMANFDVSRQSVEIRLGTLGLLNAREEEVELEHNGIDSYSDPRVRKWY